MRKTPIALILCVSVIFMAKPARAAESVKLVELFTSQSCSSCPPADKILETLAARENIIALSCHVTYWNHLDWRDPLSRQFCTSRQTYYASVLQERSVYTPQTVINGAQAFVGSQEKQIVRALENAAPLPRITLRRLEQGRIEIFLPALPAAADSVTLWLFGVQSRHTQNIPAGENSGRTLRYTNTALSVQQADAWNGKPARRIVEAPADSAIDGLIILAQGKAFGPILAAGKIDLR